MNAGRLRGVQFILDEEIELKLDDLYRELSELGVEDPRVHRLERDAHLLEKRLDLRRARFCAQREAKLCHAGEEVAGAMVIVVRVTWITVLLAAVVAIAIIINAVYSYLALTR